MALNMIIMIN